MQRMFRHTRSLTILLGLLALVAAACTGGNGDNDTPATETASGFPVTVERSDGKALTIESAPERMVVLSPGHVEMLFAIGAGGQVVAVDENSDYPPAAAAIEPKLSGFEPSAEAVAALDPDLVIVSFDPGGFVEQLDGLDIPVFFDDINTEVTTIEGVFASISELGLLTGHTTEAESLVTDLQERVNAVLAAVEDAEEAPRIYHELDTFEGFNTVSPDDFVGDLYNKLGAKNIVSAELGPYPTLQSEAIVEADPQVILLADAEFGQTPDVVMARPAWDAISAVQDGRVYAVDPDVYSRPGPRIVDALEDLAALLYPELFAN